MAKTKSGSSVTDAQIKKAHAEFSASRQELDDARMANASLAKGLDDRGIHRGALKRVDALLRMDIAKAQDYIRAFTRYSEVLGLDARLESQPEMGLQEQAPAPGEAGQFH